VHPDGEHSGIVSLFLCFIAISSFSCCRRAHLPTTRMMSFVDHYFEGGAKMALEPMRLDGINHRALDS